MKATTSLLVALAAIATAGTAAASSPSLASVAPKGGQRGTDTAFTFSGDRLADVEEIIYYTPGLSTKELAVVDDKTVTATVAAAADCALGEHQIRLRARSGISQVRTIWIGQFPTIPEAEPNSEFESPQKITPNHTVAGVFENEDVDYFAIDAKKGERLTVEIEGMRLGNAFFDPYVAILDSDRFELVTSDDTSLLLQDSIASLVVPADGTYIIQAREASYVGNGNCHYRMHVGHFPRPTIAFPAGGEAGQTLDLKLLGDPAGEIPLQVALPPHPAEEFPVFAGDAGLLSPSPNIIRVSPFPNVLEVEPNANMGAATPTTLPLPLAFNGVIGEPGDEDWFSFEAKQGEKFTFRVHARSVRSPLDPVFHIWGPDKKNIGGNDDADNRADSKFDFTAAADGTHWIRVRDHLKNGGPEYVYRVEAEPPAPALSLSIPQFARNDFQSRQMIYVARGNRFGTMLNAARANCSGDLEIFAENLPAGVTLHAETMPASINGFPVVFEAAPDAPLAGTLADLRVRLAGEGAADVSGRFTHQLDLVVGNPNNTVYYSSTVDRLAVAVVEELPFALEIEQPQVPLVRNGTLNLKVRAHRKEGFDAPITVRMLWNPPGVGSQPTMQIPKGESEVYYTLNANGDAPTQEWKVAIMGESDAGNGQILASTALTPITIAEPYVTTTIAMAAIEQGKPGEVVCTIESHREFEGAAKIRLYGLPAKTTTTELEITKESKEVRFPITTEPDSPKGQHKNLFCHIEIPEAGTTIPHNTGHGGVLRIDPPPPAPKEPQPEEAVAAAAPQPQPPADKPLSRLEKLRLEAKNN